MVRASGLRTVEELSEEALRVHPRAKLTVAGRRLLVERVLEQGWPPARAAEAQGVSVATAYKWLGRWRAEGLAGLADRSSRPRTSPRRLPADREQAILAYRAAHRVGPHRIGWALGEASSTVHAVLHRHQVPRLWELDRPTGQVVRYQRQQPGELVHLDVKSKAGSPTVAATASMGEDAGGVGGSSRAAATTSSTLPSTTAPGSPTWRSTLTSTRGRWLGSPLEPWPTTPRLACRFSGC
jgi:transposase